MRAVCGILALLVAPARALVAPARAVGAPVRAAYSPARRLVVAQSGVSEALTRDHMATLARLVSSLKGIQLGDIEEVIVTRVDESSLELQVLTCEDDGCVMVLVPVAFARPCDDPDSFEECVLSNVQRLDASLVAGSAAAAAPSTRDSAAARFITHAATDAADRPDWWRRAADGALDRACADARDVLNTEFAADVAAIAGRAGAPASGARVEDLCPAGLVVASAGRVVDVAFPEPAATVDEIHAAVLRCVADAHASAPPPPPRAEPLERKGLPADPFSPFS